MYSFLFLVCMYVVLRSILLEQKIPQITCVVELGYFGSSIGILGFHVDKLEQGTGA